LALCQRGDPSWGQVARDRTRGSRYTMHDLVRAYAAHVAADLPPETWETALRRVLDFYPPIPPA
jgi:hypothetical protein